PLARTAAPRAATSAGAGTAAALACLVGGALLARLLEDRPDALLLRFLRAGGRGCARGTRQGREQLGGDRFGRDLLADVGLDVGQRHRIALAGEADRVALGPQACGAADAVHVVLGVEGQ